MARAPCRHAVFHGPFSGTLVATGLALVLALAGMACTDAAIQNGAGAGGTGQGGSGKGGAGGGLSFKLDGSTGTGGTAGSSGPCAGTSTAVCKPKAAEG